MSKGTELTDKQKLLITYLVHEGLNWRAAMRKAGYSDRTTIETLLNSPILREAINEQLTTIMAMNGPKAVRTLEESMEDGTSPGASLRMKAATEFLDRSGLSKLERVKHEGKAPNALFILPPKDDKKEG